MMRKLTVVFKCVVCETENRIELDSFDIQWSTTYSGVTIEGVELMCDECNYFNEFEL